MLGEHSWGELDVLRHQLDCDDRFTGPWSGRRVAERECVFLGLDHVDGDNIEAAWLGRWARPKRTPHGEGSLTPFPPDSESEATSCWSALCPRTVSALWVCVQKLS